MLHTLEVSQDFRCAVRQNWNILPADVTVEVARFASSICSPSDEESTDFICPRTFFILNVRFDCKRRRGWLASDSSALVSLVSAACGLKGAEPCPKRWRTASNSANRKYSEETKTTKAMKYVVSYLLVMSGSKICALSSAQIERHSVTNWCPVALIGAIAGSTGNWGQNEETMRNHT